MAGLVPAILIRNGAALFVSEITGTGPVLTWRVRGPVMSGRER
jgi:hypothetical protein